MKKYILIILVLLSYKVNSQTLSIFDIDTTNFPIMKAKFYAFDKDGNQITNINPTDFDLKEDGINRKVLNVSCPIPNPPKALSSVLVMDVSGSMFYGPPRIQSAKDAANSWVDGLQFGQSECALVSFSDISSIITDFTNNKEKLKNKIKKLVPSGGTNYNQALIDLPCGGLQIAKKGKYKRVLIFLTDGLPNFEPRTNEIIQFANSNNITIYAVTLDMKAPQSIKDMTLQTGGQYFENITTLKEAQDTYQKLLRVAQGGDPCEITWESGVSCFARMIKVELNHLQNGTLATTIYQSPYTPVAKLEFNPESLKFLDPAVGVKTEQKVTITARNADFNVSNITSNNGGFEITPKSFVLNSGQSLELTVSYLPADSGYNFSIFELKNDFCPAKLYVTGGWTLAKQVFRTLKLLHPNGGEAFVAGSDKVITWEGIGPDEPVKIEYRLNDNYPWIKIADSAKGLSYKWRVPNTPSSKCLARVIANAKPVAYCNNSDVEICGKIWMGCNLDVVTYRNGDTIRYAKTRDEFKVACNNKEGAWCYYKDNSSNGTIYGKLYNWYAVNDPRGLAPEGWHIPTDEEWTELVNCLGGTEQAGGKLKSTGTIEEGNGLWVDPNTGATNETGFNALPGGFYANGDYAYMNKNAIWWSTLSYIRILENKTPYIIRQLPPSIESFGLSVRCIMD